MKDKGFTLLEMMIVLFSLSLIFLLSLDVLLLLHQSEQIEAGISQKEIFDLQLQHELMLAYDFKMGENLCYEKFEEEFCLSFEKQRLIKTPGYEILLYEIEEGKFSLEEDVLILSGLYQDKPFKTTYKRVK